MTSPPGPHVAFLLAQLGAEATMRFAAALSDLGLTPAQAGVLRALGSTQGLSQQALAKILGTAASRIVGHVDELQARGAVARTAGTDRRVNVVTLTPAGQDLLEQVGRVSRAHDEAVTESLTGDQRTELRALLGALAEGLGLTDAAHPGYRPAVSATRG